MIDASVRAAANGRRVEKVCVRPRCRPGKTNCEEMSCAARHCMLTLGILKIPLHLARRGLRPGRVQLGVGPT